MGCLFALDGGSGRRGGVLPYLWPGHGGWTPEIWLGQDIPVARAGAADAPAPTTGQRQSRAGDELSGRRSSPGTGLRRVQRDPAGGEVALVAARRNAGLEGFSPIEREALTHAGHVSFVAVPLWAGSQSDEITWETALTCVLVGVILAVNPWRYVRASTCRRRDRWQRGRRPRSDRRDPRGALPQTVTTPGARPAWNSGGAIAPA
jgi:hypothetical protein